MSPFRWAMAEAESKDLPNRRRLIAQEVVSIYLPPLLVYPESIPDQDAGWSSLQLVSIAKVNVIRVAVRNLCFKFCLSKWGRTYSWNDRQRRWSTTTFVRLAASVRPKDIDGQSGAAVRTVRAGCFWLLISRDNFRLRLLAQSVQLDCETVVCSSLSKNWDTTNDQNRFLALENESLLAAASIAFARAFSTARADLLDRPSH